MLDIDANLEAFVHRSLKLAPLVLAAAVLGTGCLHMVPAGSVGVQWTPAGMNQGVITEGDYPIAPWDQLTLYDARSQERDEKLEVLAVNGLRIALDASIRYHIVPGDAVKLHQELGPNYYEILLGPTLRSQARRVAGRYSPEELYSQQRETIEREIREGIEKAIKGRHVELEAVLIRNVVLPEEIQHSINEKLEAEQASLKEKFVIEVAKQENEKARLIAEADAERARIKAESDANAKRIAAKATDDANVLLDAHITDKVLKWHQLQAASALATSPNAKVLLIPEGKAVPMLSIQ